MEFGNKAMEAIRLSKMLKYSNMICKLPRELQDSENVPVVTYKLDKPIRNKILNYREIVNTLWVDDEDTLGIGMDSCDCENSEFCDPHHGHIITGDLRIIKNNKLRKLRTKGSSYREPHTINFNKVLANNTSAINNFIEKNLIKLK